MYLNKVHILTVLLSIQLLSCASTMTSVTIRRATFDLDCPTEQIVLIDLGTRTYGASGCGRKATYILEGECSLESTCQAIMNSEVNPKGKGLEP